MSTVFCFGCVTAINTFLEHMSGQSAEAQARLTASLRDVVSFMESAGVQAHSIALLNEFIAKHQTVELLGLAENYGSSTAYVGHDQLMDHDQLMNLLYTSWSLLFDGYTIEKKILLKRIKLLREDKKTDPEVLARLENTLADIEQKKAHVLVNVIRFKAMITIPLADFRADKDFDYMGRHKENIERRKYLLSAASKK